MRFKIILIMFILLMSLNFISAISGGEVLIVLDNDVLAGYEGMTSETYYQGVLGNITYGAGLDYNLTIWNQTSQGRPSLSYLQSYSFVIWSSADWVYDGGVYVPDSIDRERLESFVLQGGKLIIYYGNNNMKIAESASLRDGKWHHIIGIYDGTSPKVYLDGIKLTLGVKISTGKGIGDEKISIGNSLRQEGKSNFFKGNSVDK